jgi:uncharacterized coiled-coil DUF342 family protein
MDRSERKDKIGDLIERIGDIENELTDHLPVVEKAIAEAEKIDETFSELPNGVEGWDLEEITDSIHSSTIEGTIHDEVREEIQEFKNEIEEYASELSNKKRENIEDKYGCLQEVVDYFEIGDGNTIDDVLFDIAQAKELLIDLKKNP